MAPIEDTTTEAAAVAELAQRAAVPEVLTPEVGECYAVQLPPGHILEIPDIEKHALTPFRPRGIYQPATVDALVAHVDRHFDAAHTTLWVHPDSGRIVALLNDHAAFSGSGTAPGAGAGWRDHRSVLQLEQTDEWNFWIGKDGSLMPQGTFAQHFEDGIKELVDPAASVMLELAQSFQAAQNASFKQATRLRDGTVQVQWNETVDATAGKSGEIPIPDTFTLAIAPFLGEEPAALTARLRYRLNGGQLQLGYKLERPDDVVRDTLSKIADRLTEKFTHVFIGTPPAA